MNYRDDREALHHRVAKLESELEEARREGEEHGRDEAQARAAELEKKLADMRKELETMSSELEALRAKAPPPKVPAKVPALVPIVIGAVAMLCLMMVIGIVFSRSSAPPPAAPVVVAQPPPPPAPTPTPTPTAPATASTTIPLEPIAPPAVPRSTTARWNATVKRVEGLPIAVGSTCMLEATIKTSDTNALVPDFNVQCGTQSVYRTSDGLNGISQSSNDAREVLGPSDDKSTFTLVYRDIGTRTGARNQVDVDTTKHEGVVFRETIPRFRVELSLPTTSTPGAPLSGAEQRLRRHGKVIRVSGTAPVKEGASCVVRAMATGQGKSCTAEVACGTTILWPGSAPAKCTYASSRPTGISTDDGPTSLSLEDSTFPQPPDASSPSALRAPGSSLHVKGKAFEADVSLDDVLY
jgi:hypothetical protein